MRFEKEIAVCIHQISGRCKSARQTSYHAFLVRAGRFQVALSGLNTREIHAVADVADAGKSVF